MHRRATPLVLALCVLGCRSEPPGEPVVLVTAPAEPCYAYPRDVLLVADPAGGLLAHYSDGTAEEDVPIVWPLGYFGRRDGDAIVVYDGDRIERAMTGMTASIMPGDMSPEFGGVRATCLSLTPESGPHPPEWYVRTSPAPASSTGTGRDVPGASASRDIARQ